MVNFLRGSVQYGSSSRKCLIHYWCSSINWTCKLELFKSDIGRELERLLLCDSEIRGYFWRWMELKLYDYITAIIRSNLHIDVIIFLSSQITKFAYTWTILVLAARN